MAQKNRAVRRIDEINPNLRKGGAQLLTAAIPTISAPSIPNVPAPQDITIVNETILRTTLVPKVLVEIEWIEPENLIPELYQVEAAKDVNFTTGKIIRATTSPSIAIELDTDTDYWIRVQAVVRGVYGEYGYPSNYPVVSIHTSEDTTPPNPVTGNVANWTTSDLRLSWTNPSSSNFLQTRVRIYDTFGGTLYKEIFVVGNPGSTSQYIFTADENNRVTAGTYLKSVYYELLAYSIGGVPAVSSATGTATKAKPTIPAGLINSWSGDDGTYDEGLTITWNPQTDVDYVITIDSIARTVYTNHFIYPYTTNVADHRPTLASGKFNPSFTVQARDRLGQVSPGVSGTATNLAPVASNLALTTVPGFSALFAYVNPTKEILDFHHYTWILASGSTEIQRVTTFTPETSFTSLNGTYAIAVQAVDMFGRASAKVSASGIVLDGLTIAQLRAETDYTNSLGTNPTVLAGLKDNNLVQSVFTVASGTAWQWTLAQRALKDRYRTVTVALSGAATNMPRLYFGFSNDDSTYSWYAGPLVATGTTGQSTTLTAYANETLAQNNAVLATNINRFDLPSITEARYIKMGHRGNTHHFAEYYARRLVQTDDLEAESIKSISIAADAVLANHIFVVNLEAIQADMGNLHMDGVIDIETTGGIYQGTGSFASPTTGLKLYNTGGIGRFTTYSGGLSQVDFDTIGRLTAGAGAVLLDRIGVTISGSASTVNLFSVSPVVTPRSAAIQWNNPNGSQQSARILGNYQGQVQVIGEGVVLAIPVTNSEYYGLQLRNTGVHTIVAEQLSINPTGGLQSGITITLDGVDEANTIFISEGRIDSNANKIRTLGTQAGFAFEDRSTSDIWEWYASGDFANLYNGTRVIWQTTADGSAFYLFEDASTNTVVTPLNIYRRSTGTPAAGLGAQIFFALEGSTGVDRSAGSIQVLWTDATDTSRNSDMRFFAYDGNAGASNAREFFRGGSTAANVAGIGFFASGATAKQTVTGAKGGNAALTSLLTALANYGLITDSTT